MLRKYPLRNDGRKGGLLARSVALMTAQLCGIAVMRVDDAESGGGQALKVQWRVAVEACTCGCPAQIDQVTGSEGP